MYFFINIIIIDTNIQNFLVILLLFYYKIINIILIRIINQIINLGLICINLF